MVAISSASSLLLVSSTYSSSDISNTLPFDFRAPRDLFMAMLLRMLCNAFMCKLFSSTIDLSLQSYINKECKKGFFLSFSFLEEFRKKVGKVRNGVGKIRMILGVKLDFFVLVIHGNLPSYHGLKLHSNHIADEAILSFFGIERTHLSCLPILPPA